MWKYVVKRLLWLVVILLGVGILIFTIMYFVPGDPADIILSSTSTAAEKQAWRDEQGLNDPYIVQLGRFLSDTFLHFDFGTSYKYRVSVMSEFAQRVPRTLTLGWICLIIDALIGIPLGIVCATHRNGIVDHGLMVGAMVGVSIPNFWLALLMVILFSLKLHWLPSSGIGSWKCWIMPIIAGSLTGIAMNARQTRSAVLETIRADFVTTARAKGLPERRVIYQHMLPNALIPVINQLGGQFANALAGTVVIETVFSFPGIGTYMMTAISNRDYPVIRGCVMVLAAFSAVAVLLVDIIYAYIDPRIKAQYANLGAKKGSVKA
jgi:peptide/nickel transport system permease protein